MDDLQLIGILASSACALALMFVVALNLVRSGSRCDAELDEHRDCEHEGPLFSLLVRGEHLQ